MDESLALSAHDPWSAKDTAPLKPAVSPVRQAATARWRSRILVLRPPSRRKGLQAGPVSWVNASARSERMVRRRVAPASGTDMLSDARRRMARAVAHSQEGDER